MTSLHPFPWSSLPVIIFPLLSWPWPLTHTLNMGDFEPTLDPSLPMKCDRYYTENNRTTFIYGGYEGIPENLLINFIVWMVSLINDDIITWFPYYWPFVQGIHPQGSFCICAQPMRDDVNCNIISHGLGTYTEWSLHPSPVDSLHKGPVIWNCNIFFKCCLPEEAFQQTVDILVIWDAMMLMWYGCNDSIYI